jgi:hypothetical protein
MLVPGSIRETEISDHHRIILTVRRKELLIGQPSVIAMLEIIAAVFVVLSIGILIAHALDAFRP